MGTSKGYIPPTTEQWSRAKRAVTSYIKNGDSDSRANATSKFSSAMHQDIDTASTFIKAAGNILSFTKAVSYGGIDNALNDFGRSDLIGKSSDEIYHALIQDFTNCGSTNEEYLSAEAISSALKELKVTDMENLKYIESDLLLKEMLIEYIKFSFSYRYEEKIRMKKTAAETEKLIKEMNKYISNNLHSQLDLSAIKTVDFGRMDRSDIVKKSLEDAYEVFEMFYGEE